MANCLNCTNQANCINCSPGYYLNSINFCTPCEVNYCLICNSTGKTCLQCVYNAYLNATSLQCFFCSYSIPNCQTCSFISTQLYCSICSNGYYLPSFISPNCVACPVNCLKCSTSLLNSTVQCFACI